MANDEQPLDDEATLQAEEESLSHPTGGGNKFTQFMRSVWAELQRVSWPDREQVFKLTGVVLGFVVIMGIYLGGLDWVWEKVVKAIIGN